MGIQNRDEGIIENIIFSNIQIESRLFADIWWGKAEPIYITTFCRSDDSRRRFAPDQKKGKAGEIKNIRFHNISCKSENGIYLSGCNEARPNQILFDGIQIEINKSTHYQGGLYDRRPCDVPGIISPGTMGFYLNNADNVQVKNCTVSWGSNRPDYFTHAYYAQDVNELILENNNGKSAHEKMKKTIIKN